MRHDLRKWISDCAYTTSLQLQSIHGFWSLGGVLIVGIRLKSHKGPGLRQGSGAIVNKTRTKSLSLGQLELGSVMALLLPVGFQAKFFGYKYHKISFVRSRSFQINLVQSYSRVFALAITDQLPHRELQCHISDNSANDQK
ncbi:hypothetical protein TWF569_007713 [Orbilia oligospora]|uniref:Uncharacterized protein n=1 Tax=Orbilia oligospora TaxID=2813651 RepID=A0A7C8J6X6_ORBOL|nr:hypothetical protein TWF102_007880 [Orbilia oligospora]KAF3111077.1 hypothetical protein TWF706_000513 [Orbilia oligospora]KAF3141942.1 hypothetical protein TWF569_007713 [Orbilia oligospora]